MVHTRGNRPEGGNGYKVTPFGTGPAGYTPTLHWQPPSAVGSVSPGVGMVSR